MHLLVQPAAVGDREAAHAPAQRVEAAADVAVRTLRDGRRLEAVHELLAAEGRSERGRVLGRGR